jgi:Undecaprenyl-phosphate glucose phosphotransferase
MLSVAISGFLFKNSVLDLDYSRAMILYAWLLTILLVTIGRWLHHRLKKRLQVQGWGMDRVLIVGTGEVGHMILQKIQWRPELGYQVVGMVETNHYDNGRASSVPILGGPDRIAEFIDRHEVDEVIIALPEASHQEILRLISQCERGSVSIKVFPDVFQIMASQVSIGDLGGLPLLSVRDVALRGWRLTVKRAVDIVGSVFGLIFLSPLMLLIGLLIKLDSPGPVFYAQERMGLDARPFWCLKFRSMRADAEKDGPGWTVENDPRRTRVGEFIRRFSLDELPQLINVLLGQMSLVGPRPERPVYVDQFRRSIPRYMDRHREKAGLTGWAQVNGLRGDTSITERTKYDLWYIENWSLMLDFKIIVRTVFNVFRSRSAY